MRSFKGIKISGYEQEGPFKFTQFADDKGTDWYTTRDEDQWGSVIMTDPSGLVVSYAELAETLSVFEGCDIFEVDPSSVPADCLGNYKFTDGAFIMVTDSTAQVSRTKEDIMADLLKLQEELKAL